MSIIDGEDGTRPFRQMIKETSVSLSRRCLVATFAG